MNTHGRRASHGSVSIICFLLTAGFLLALKHSYAQSPGSQAGILGGARAAGTAKFLSEAADPSTAIVADNGAAAKSADMGFWARWFARVKKTQAEQPHWITPLVTTTPRLEEEFRYDIAWQGASNGIVSQNYGFGKGLELIPVEPLELIVSPPPYVVPNQPGKPAGFGDMSFLAKYRLLAANEENGNYILTVFLGASVPTGKTGIGARDAIVTPTIAGGKGFGDFDIQSTLGWSLPTGDGELIGRSMISNTVLQYHVGRFLWPEVESNAIYFLDGPNGGKTQIFLTPGLVLGRLHLYRRLGLTLGGGLQVAATHFHVTNHNWILSVRFPF